MHYLGPLTTGGGGAARVAQDPAPEGQKPGFVGGLRNKSGYLQPLRGTQPPTIHGCMFPLRQCHPPGTNLFLFVFSPTSTAHVVCTFLRVTLWARPWHSPMVIKLLLGVHASAVPTNLFFVSSISARSSKKK